MTAVPPLSVVMPVHNALPYLDEAVLSLVGQSFGDFELLILDDGSTDGSSERLRDWAARDRRIRLIVGERRLGPAGSSIRIVAEAAAPIVARMDADDRSCPDRLQRQMQVLAANPSAGLVGTLCEIVDAAGQPVHPADPWRLFNPSPLAPFTHGSIMFRRALFERIGGYDQTRNFWEDIDLCLRMARSAPALVIPEALYVHRLSATSTRLTTPREEVEAAYDHMFRYLAEYRRDRGVDPRTQDSARDAEDRIAPQAMILMASPTLWAGGRPRIFRRLLSRGDLKWNRASAAALGWALWASLSPASLRACLRLLNNGRNVAARRRLAGMEYVEWQTGPHPTETIETIKTGGRHRPATHRL